MANGYGLTARFTLIGSYSAHRLSFVFQYRKIISNIYFRQFVGNWNCTYFDDYARRIARTILLARLYIVLEGQLVTVADVCRLSASEHSHMQRNSSGAAHGGPVVLRPVRATPFCVAVTP